MIKIISFSGSFSDSGKDGIPTMSLGDVIDEFLNEDSLSDSGSSEKSDLTTSGIGSEEIDDLDTGDQKFSSGSLFLKAGGFSMNRVIFFGLDGSSLVNRFSDDVHDTAEGLGSDGDFNGGAQILHTLASDESISGVQSNGADSGVSQMLSNFQD